MIFLPPWNGGLPTIASNPPLRAHLGELERPVERVAVGPLDRRDLADRAAALDQPVRRRARAARDPRQSRARRVASGSSSRPHAARDVRACSGSASSSCAERGADDEVADQPRVLERRSASASSSALRSASRDVAHDERLELAAQRERAFDGALDLVEAERRGCAWRGQLGSRCATRSWRRSVMPSSESPARSAWSTNENGRSLASVISQSESLAISTAIGFLSTP